MQLFEALETRVSSWRTDGYPTEYPALGEILRFAFQGEGARALRFLRPPQLKALETYWYLRLVAGTPRVPDLYREVFPSKKDLLEALGIPQAAFAEAEYDLDTLWQRLTGDGEADRAFVEQFRLEALRETFQLDYPSYILALAMGAGKTILIGAIIATEFALGLEYPEGPFIRNALVFAPGLTIFGALRELADIPFDLLLPERLHRAFAANLKLTFTRDGEKDLPIIRGSRYNLVVTNTEKIRIQKPTVRQRAGQTVLQLQQKEEQAREEANLRLQALASLPSLGIFSDEAHHTYGQSLDQELKRVRRTVDYLHEKTPLVCVVNTTGTPYFGRQPLRDVVVWYGLAQGIRDGFLKKVAGNIRSYAFDDRNTHVFVERILRDFFRQYGDVRLPTNGAWAKLALYFPQNDDLDEMLPHVQAAVIAAGQPAGVILRNTSRSTEAEVRAFDDLNNPASPHRVILLVDKGTEGWNCPSLFACALARRLRNSNNFVLQTATRCLREVPGNRHKASIYLSADNERILDRQLQETYHESLGLLNRTDTLLRKAVLEVKKPDIPRLIIRRKVPRVVEVAPPRASGLSLSRPADVDSETLVERRLALDESRTGAVLRVQGRELRLQVAPATLDLFALATDLGESYRLPSGDLLAKLRALYPGEGEVPEVHRDLLAAQIEGQTQRYQVVEEEIVEALALLKLEGFERTERDGRAVYTTTIQYNASRGQELLLAGESVSAFNPRGLAFHYDPYNFDSVPEREFLVDLLHRFEGDGRRVREVLFTGGLTSPRQTDLLVQYLGEDGRFHHYTPDFVLFLDDDQVVIVEIKSEEHRTEVERELAEWEQGIAPRSKEGRKAMAVKRWEQLDPDRLKYEILFAADRVPDEDVDRVVGLVEKE